jgi:hypothetical protein
MQSLQTRACVSVACVANGRTRLPAWTHSSATCSAWPRPQRTPALRHAAAAAWLHQRAVLIEHDCVRQAGSDAAVPLATLHPKEQARLVEQEMERIHAKVVRARPARPSRPLPLSSRPRPDSPLCAQSSERDARKEQQRRYRRLMAAHGAQSSEVSAPFQALARAHTQRTGSVDHACTTAGCRRARAREPPGARAA